jgi:acyl-CoA reductase-like NAD-dependent aldehyde dehydrogenase
LLVQRQVYEANLQILGAMANQVKVGDPMDGTTNMGPVISVAALDRILARVDQGQSDGACLIAGGARIGGDHAVGSFLPITILADVNPDCALAWQEVFGPVLAATPFDAEE